jgi:Xaa-Pro dipeptidase
MYPHQAERLSEALERAGVVALVATSPANVAYLTGFVSLSRAIFPTIELAVFTRDGTALVVPTVETPSVVDSAVDVDHVVAFPTTGAGVADPAEALAEALHRLGVHHGSLGLDGSGLSHEAGELLVSRLGGFKLTAASEHLAAARRVKSPFEIECLGRALGLAEEALDVVIQKIERGMTEREAATLFGTEIVKRGGWPYPPVIAMGARGAIPAPWPTDRALRSGDLVRFDVGCVHKGYCGRVGRTAVLGDPDRRGDAVYRSLQTGLEAAVAAAKARTPAARVFDAAVEVVRASGLADYAPTHVGHGIGLEPCEGPGIHSGNPAPLEMAEVLCVEASHYESGSMGVSIRNTVLVTSVGARVLNRSQHGLVVLD